jgi:prepilin signal peptidase PulO-like enzyme (type II secretory pathway)
MFVVAPKTIIGLVIVALLIFSAGFDLKYMILPDFSTGILIIMALLGVIFDEPNIIPYLVSAGGASGFLGLLYIVTRGKGMGMGDVKLAVFMGLFLGWPKIVVAFYLAFIGGAIAGVILLAMKKVKMKSEIAFGPFLILGTVVAWYYGDEVLWLVSKMGLR